MQKSNVLFRTPSDGWTFPPFLLLSFFFYQKVLSRRSARLFSSRRNLIWAPLPPHAQASVFPPPLVRGRGEGYTLASGRGGGSVLIPTRGQTLWFSHPSEGTLGIGTLCFLLTEKNRTLDFGLHKVW